MLTEAEAFDAVYRYFESLFPRACGSCGRRYETLGEYIAATTPVGSAMSFDAEEGNWGTTRPLGSLALANCACGSTMSLGTGEMRLSDRLALLEWVKAETARRNVSASEVLEGLRARVRRRALGEGAA